MSHYRQWSIINKISVHLPESGDITLIASTTENPYFYIYPALLSRCTVFEFKALQIDDIKEGLVKASKYLDISIEEEALTKLAMASNGDMRKALNNLDFLANSLKDNIVITDEAVSSFIDKAHIAYLGQVASMHVL